ncbi:helix-turn-helix transcriptional regulator [Marivibrio halodurans]|uniref:Helix-turn-helix transcriptional regulator n=1 Tax=Marivibrio halodurans TaxID=2039722 RepID=A0A8J7RXN9_9PROT|nr:helix-turn-helix transcriptional regulator [Marivibrio halodurans]MBP5856460.1 helix-turn-helix transcriptional regulator [Marivibrio halodurans]
MMTMMHETKSPWHLGGEWIAGLRAAQQITQAELAEQVGAPSTLWIEELEAGRHPVPSVYFQAFAKQFGWAEHDFAARCLSYFDPTAYRALFGEIAPSAPVLAAVRRAA